MMLNKRLLSAAIKSALAVSLLSLAGLSVASAQDATTPESSNVKKDSKAVVLKEVTVTGSRIPGVDLETQQPIFTMTQEDIKKTGLTDVGDIVQQMTTMSLPGYNKSSVLNGAGGSFVNMRNLGSQRVLVLVNGKRWISGIGGATDVSNIPAALIERVEVLKDGASAVYGSDAISGVINFILKDRFEGSQFNAYYGENQGGDAQTTQYSFTTGAKSDKGSIVFNVNYNKRGVVWANSRPMTNYAYSPNHPNGTNEAGPWGLIYNSPMNPGQYLMLNHTGSTSSDPRDPANYHVYTGDPADEFNFTSQKMYQMPTELNSIFTHAMYNITDKITAKMSAMYSARTSSDQIAGNPLNYNSQRNYPVYVDGQSYYNPFPGTDLKWNRMMTEIPPQYTDKYKSYHLDGSVDGYFDLGEHEWNWSVGFNYNHGEGVTQGTGEWNLLALKKALGPSFLNGDGVVQCGSAAAPIPLGTSYQLGQCTPVSILAGPGNIPANGLAYILAPSTDTFGSTDRSYNADINGTLFDLPAGGLGFAAGVESRELTGYSRPDSFAQTGYTSSNAANPTSGKYRVNSAYVEFKAPLLKDLPGVQSLTVDVASRYSHYSNFGSTTDNKYSFEWKPINDLLVRGNYAEGFRAPTLQDLFGGGGQGYDHYLDQCDSVFGAAASNPGVAAACAGQGVPADFRQRDRQNIAITSVGAVQSATPSFIGVGNEKLQPETAVTKTLGVVYSPGYVPGLDLTLDWYAIRINNEIQSISAQYVVNQCYLYSSPQYCGQFGRDATTHQITTLSRGNANLGHIETKGYDFSVNYRFPVTRYGHFNSRLDANYVSEFQSQSGPGATVVNSIGIIPQYRVRANLTTSWEQGSFGATWRLRYFGGLRDECYTSTECNEPNYRSPSWPFGVGANRKGATAFNDVSGRWSAPWNATITLGINNLFDKKPSPLYSAKALGYNGAAGLDPALDIDRYFYVSYQQKF